MPGKSLTLTRHYDASPDMMFRLWTEVEHLKQWWGPRCFDAPVVEVDLRIGGAYLIMMRGPDGVSFPCRGEYREIVPGRKLVFTNNAFDPDGNQMSDGLTSVTFMSENGGTRLTIETEATVKEAHQFMLTGMDQGWSQTLDKLGEHAATV